MPGFLKKHLKQGPGQAKEGGNKEGNRNHDRTNYGPNGPHQVHITESHGLLAQGGGPQNTGGPDNAAAHKTSLTGIEADDPALLFRYFDGFFLYGFFLSWSKNDYKDLFDPNLRDTSKRDFNWMEKVWKRVLVSEKQDRIVGKLFSLGTRLPKFLDRFPDAKILYTVRDPLATVPSGMSLVTGVLDGAFGFWKLPEEKRSHFLQRLYKALLELSMRFQQDYTAGKFPPDKVKVVTFDRLMQDFDTLMLEIVDFVGEPLTPELEKTIGEAAEKQRSYSSGHKYDLQKFGLTEEQIRKDFAPIYETFFN